jgi:iron-sulfur cluster repair protein YtfE (RIC family)
MLPSQVRRTILDDHEHLRAALVALEKLAQALTEGDHEPLAQALAALRAMKQRFFDHLDLEEAIMVPALRDADAWGPDRAELVLNEHREQRAELEALVQELGRAGTAPPVVGQRILSWIEALRADMVHEESAVLSPDLLRDDVISIDLEAG